MKITLLGTGTPTPSAKRVSSGYLVETGKSKILLDHGPGAAHRYLQTGRRITEISHLFFSHLHYDHCVDYPRLVLQRWDQSDGGLPELEVYGPPPLKQMTESLFGTEGAFSADIEARINNQASIDIFEKRGGTPPRRPPAPRIRELAPGEVIRGPDWTVTVGEAQHMQPYLSCLAYRLESDGGSFCYSGDSGGKSERIIALASGCDVLIHMVHFLSGTEPTEAYRQTCGNHLDTAYIAKEAGVKTLVLSHILEQIDQPGVRERVITEMSGIFKGTIIWGEDLMEVPIQDAGPGRME